MDTYPLEFAEVQKQPNEDLSKACEELFDILDTFVVEKKSRAASVWPLQIMLLILSPKVLEIVNADSGPPDSPRYSRKKQFIDSVKRSLRMHGSSSSRQLSEAAAITCVNLTKAATYVSNAESSNNVILILVQQLRDDLMNVLFNPSKPFSRGQNYSAQDVDLMIDSFVSFFRINPHNNEVFKFCLNVNYSSTYQFVLVSSLYKQVSKIFSSLVAITRGSCQSDRFQISESSRSRDYRGGRRPVLYIRMAHNSGICLPIL